MIARTLAAAAVVAAAFAGTANAGFPEKDITFLIPFSPGGGMDTTSRAVARVMGKYLPNNVNVVPKNVPGAGGNKGYGVLQRAKGDGYTISVINYPGAAMPHLTGEKVAHDITSFTWLGRMSVSDYMLAANKQSGIKSLRDVKAYGKPVKISQTGFGSTAYAAAGVLKMVVGFEAVHLTGYKSSKEYILGMVRGDGDLSLAPVQTYYKLVQSGDAVPVVTFEATSTIPGVRTIAQEGYPDLTGLGVQRYIAAGPGVPADVRRILSEAIQKAIADPENQAWAEKTRRPFHPLDANATETEVKKSLAFYTKYKAALGKQ